MNRLPQRGDLVYVAGPAGAGKSALVTALTAAWGRHSVREPVPHDILHQTDVAPTLMACEIGRRIHGGRAGSDALGAHLHGRACAWLSSCPYKLVIVEGDRLATLGFIDAAVGAGYRVHLIHLDLDAEQAAARLGERDVASGWRAGRATKAARLADYCCALGQRVVHLDATRPVRVLLKQSIADVEPLTVLDQ